MHARSLFAGLALLSWGTTAEAAPKEDVEHQFAVTISPIHLIMPMVEVMVEGRVNDKVSVAGIGGLGQVTVKSSLGTEETFTVYELGAQGRYYVLGDFDHGLQVGVDATYLGVSGTMSSDTSVSGSGAGLALGPFAGYKIAADIGFTFDFQLGWQYLAMKAESEDSDTGQTVKGEDSSTAVLLNINLGWSF